MISKSLQHTPQSSFCRSEGSREYQRLENRILEKTGIVCSILVTPGLISIRCQSYPDFLLAKLAIKDLAKGRNIVQGVEIK